MANNKPQRSLIVGETCISLCGDDGVEFNGKRYVPDATLAYFTFEFSRAFPSATIYQTALHPAVIAKSFQGLINKGVNYEHQMAAWNPDKDIRDRVIGHVVDATFPQGPMGGWAVTPDVSQAPSISGIAAMYKHAQGMADLLGLHQTGRRKYAVSMEVLWTLPDSGFAVALPKSGKPQFNFSPPDILRAGYEYIPYDKSPGDLIATYSEKSRRIVAQYKGRKVFVLEGGLSNPVHYAGLGVVHFPAEPQAAIQRLLASRQHPLDAAASAILASFPVK